MNRDGCLAFGHPADELKLKGNSAGVNRPRFVQAERLLALTFFVSSNRMSGGFESPCYAGYRGDL